MRPRASRRTSAAAGATPRSGLDPSPTGDPDLPRRHAVRWILSECESMQLYEAMFLLDNREVKKGFDAARERVTTLLTKHGAKPRVVRKWDERKLAYEIARQKRGTDLI